MLDVGDLSVPSFGTEVIKARVIKWCANCSLRAFSTFFQNKKNITFTRTVRIVNF